MEKSGTNRTRNPFILVKFQKLINKQGLLVILLNYIFLYYYFTTQLKILSVVS